MIDGLRCKFCKSDDLIMVDTEGVGSSDEYYYYIYHYSLDYELGCKQRIGLLQISDNLERKE